MNARKTIQVVFNKRKKEESLSRPNWRQKRIDSHPVLVLEVDKNAAEILTIFLYAVIEFFDVFLI